MEDYEYVDKYDIILDVLTNEVTIDGKPYTLKEELDKFFVKGNKTAGVRVRKFMQIVKQISQEIRDDVQTYKKSL